MNRSLCGWDKDSNLPDSIRRECERRFESNISRATVLRVLIQPPALFPLSSLEGRVRILKQLLKVRLKPTPRLRRRRPRIRKSAMRIIPRRARIARPIALTPRLHPHKRILVAIPRVRRRPHPNPVPLTLHQSPHAYCDVGWTPLRPVSVMKCAGKPSASRSGPRAFT